MKRMAIAVTLVGTLAPALPASSQPATGGTITDGDVVFVQGNSPTSGAGIGPMAELHLLGPESGDHLFQNWWWYREEGVIFKGGSGSGVNLSKIRSSFEPLEGGGTASGPVSFMRGADASAGTIKSGGKTRRAAKMVILDADHPDVEEFIWCKVKEERKARVLRDAGLVDVRTDAQRRLYRVRPEPLRELDDWLAPFRAMWSERLDDLERHLDAMPDEE